jgi:UDP-3-O-[3-hydroxymyristoyl] glucosamine N-acyltransferase
MKFDRKYSLAEIGQLLQAETFGDSNAWVDGINEIHRIEKHEIVFVDHPKYYEKALSSKASVVLINKQLTPPPGKGIVVCEDPFKSFNFLLNYFNPYETPVAAPPAAIGKNCSIAPSVFIGENVTLGDDCIIYPGVQLLGNITIGNRVIIQSNTILGSLGFYYKNRGTHFDRLLSRGDVVLEDEVEIGANCTIDRGVTASTRIGAGTKIDNQVQIGHDTEIGKRCLIAAQCGIAGCVTIQDRVTLWGQVGIASGITIGEGAVLQAKSGVGKSLAPNKTYFGAPAEESRIKLRELAAIRNLSASLQKQKKNG